MPDRKQTPDIMSELMAGQETPARKPVSQKDDIPVKQHDGIMVGMKKKARQKQTEKALAAEAKPIKATFYLSPESIESLERIWMKRRQETEPLHRGRITKSGLVEEAICLLSRKVHSRAGNPGARRKGELCAIL